jgi:hypothetical protein
MIDDDIATLKHLAGRDGEDSPALAGLGGFRGEIRGAPSLRSGEPLPQRSDKPSCCAAPDWTRRPSGGAIKLWHACIVGMVRESFFIAGLRPAPAFAERPRSEGVRIRVDQPSDMPRVAPERKGRRSRRPCHSGYPDRRKKTRVLMTRAGAAVGGRPSTLHRSLARADINRGPVFRANL